MAPANVAHHVATIAREHWETIMGPDAPRMYITLPDGGAVIIHKLTDNVAAIMPQVTYTRPDGTPGFYTPDSRSRLSTGATLTLGQTFGALSTINLVCNRAYRATLKEGN